MIRSMTGYARAEIFKENVGVTAEIRSWNHRHLDPSIRLPGPFLGLEEKIRKLVAENAERGHLEIRVLICRENGEDVEFEIDEAGIRSYHAALSRLREITGISDEISLDHLARVPGLIVSKEAEADPEGIWPLVRECLETTLESWNLMRSGEGDFLAADLSLRMDSIEEDLAGIAEASAELVATYKDRLMERIRILTEGVETDPDRIAQESAFFADKSDISEEIVRSRSHIAQFRALMKGEEPAGRKLNFLLQEMNREFNTIGSKIGKAEISHKVVEIKSTLEKIREQIQNIE